MAIFQGSEDQNKAKSMLNGVTGKSVLRYTMMPEILPRIRALGMHFGHFAYLLALVFASARLIPQTHPSLNAANIGRFGVRQVIAIAANNITWSRKNIDQIGIFTAIVLGLIMIVIQAGLIAIAALVGVGNEANAQSFFETESPENDLVLQTLNVVFGRPAGGDFFFADQNPDIYGISGNYQPIYDTIYQILSLYSMATMVIAVIIVLYYIMTVVGEAAKTGTPFGSRFNSLWAPIRLVVALGLLVPLGSGLNSAQYIVMQVAKMGTGLGNQAWYIFFDNVVTQDPSAYVVSNPRDYNLNSLVNQIFLAEVCAQGYNKFNGTALGGNGFYGAGQTYQRTANLNAGAGTYTIAWEETAGNTNDLEYTECGRLELDASLSSTIRRAQGSGHTRTVTDPDNELVPIAEIYNLVQTIVNDQIIPVAQAQATDFVGYHVPTGGGRTVTVNPSQDVRTTIRQLGDDVSNAYRDGISDIYTNSIAGDLQEKLISNRDGGWAYAGVWYMQIGRIIQQLESPITTAIPEMTLPDSTASAARGVDGPQRSFLFGLIETGGDEVQNAIFLIDGLITRMTGAERVAARNGSVNQTDAAIGLGAEIGGGFLSTRGNPLLGAVGGLLDGLGGIIIIIGLLGIGVGFLLFFLVPLLPFIYFFFAIMTWIMEIIEAIIAMPLWALSFLQIGGEGFPGQSAISGFYILLSILIRPAVIVLSLILGYLVFIFGTYMLSMLFDPLLNVVKGENTKGFSIMVFTVIFATLVYNIGMTAFKMVDTIPASIMRWIGQNVGVFQDGKGDAAGDSRGMMMATGGIITGFASQQLSQGARGVGQALGGVRVGGTPGGGGTPGVNQIHPRLLEEEMVELQTLAPQ